MQNKVNDTDKTIRYMLDLNLWRSSWLNRELTYVFLIYYPKTQQQKERSKIRSFRILHNSSFCQSPP